MFDFLAKKFSSLLNGLTAKKQITQSDIDSALVSVKDALLQADVPHAVVEQFCAQVSEQAVGQKLTGKLKPGQEFVKIVHERMTDFLGGTQQNAFTFELPSTILVMGLQGSGKTTTIAKLAHWICAQAQAKGKQRRILLASVDYYRPAAIDQLEVLSKQVGVDFYRARSTDPVAAAREIAQYAKKELYELLFVDTAGRLHIDKELMAELVAVERAVLPRYKLLVLDAMTGQESLSVAQHFDKAVPFDFSILTKMDSEVRAGAAFAFRYALKKPIMFIGVGEKPAELERFHPERMASRILGMGDMLSLIEKANQEIKQQEQQALYKSINTGRMTLQDFADQMAMMNRLGSLSSLMKYLPGLGTQLTPEMIQKGELELKKFKAIISSMTSKERQIPKLLDNSRKSRVARGAGVQVADVNQLLERFEQSQQYVKLVKKWGRVPPPSR